MGFNGRNAMTGAASGFGAGGLPGGVVGGVLGGFFGGGGATNPADAAQPYLDRIPGTITPYYQPYIDAGKQAMGQVMPQYQNLMNNPGQFMNNMGKDFQASPGYQYQVDQATNASNQAAAAGGMLGSPAQQKALAGDISGMANQDYENWLNHAWGAYSTGLQGMQGINTMGYGASNQLAGDLASALMNQAQLAYSGAANANQSGGGMLG